MKQVGYLKVGSSMGKPIRAARAISVPGGCVVRLLTDTPVAHAGDRSRDYPFGVVEMVIPVDGTKGHGNLVAMAQFSFDKAGTLQVSAYGTMPVRLEEIVMKKK